MYATMWLPADIEERTTIVLQLQFGHELGMEVILMVKLYH